MEILSEWFRYKGKGHDVDALAEFNFKAGIKTKKGVLVAAIHSSILPERFSQDRAKPIKV